MKKWLALLLALLLLSGCAGEATVETASSSVPETAEGRQLPDSTLPEGTGTEPAPETDAPATDVPATDAPVTESAPTGTESAPATDAPVTEEPETEPIPTLESVDPWSLVGVSYFDQGFYDDELGNSYTWGYELPMLEAETSGAEEINNRIDASFGEMVRESLRCMDAGESLAMVHCGFRAMVWENVLILHLIGHMDWDYTEYGIYCYDYTTGRYLDTRGLLKEMAVSQQDFLEAVRTQSIQYYKDEYAALPEDMKRDNGYYEGLERMEKGEFVNLDLMAYPDENGSLVVIVPVVSLAGPDYYYQEISLGLGAVG